MNTDSTMPLSLFDELKRELARYVQGEISVQTFHSWFAPILWEIESSDESDAEELAYDVTLRLSEYSRGQWSEPELKRLLKDLTNVPASFN